MKLGVEEIDGRPLYQYRVSLQSAGLHELNSIEMWEMLIEKPNSREDQVARFLAPVAAARFASNYEEGAPSWDHCGEAVSNLRDKSFARFSTLLERSLDLYRIKPLKLRDGRTGWLETIIGQAGLPAGMLKPGRVLRVILDELMAHLGSGGEGTDELARSLVNRALSEEKLRPAYRDAGHLPGLCADLVRVVVDLTAEAGWTGGDPQAIWAIAQWEERLPFRVSQQTAQEIVGHLLKVAIQAAGGGDIGIARVLHRTGTDWKLKTRAVVSGQDIDLSSLGVESLPSTAAVFYTVNGQPVEEALRIRRGEQASFRVLRGPNELASEHGSWEVPISLALHLDGQYQPIATSGGDALDPNSAWVFEAKGFDYVFKAPAPVRLRAKELIVAVGAGDVVSGSAQKLQGASLVTGGNASGRRELWKVTGRASIERANEESTWVEAGFKGAQSHMDFRGKPPSSFHVEGCASVFVGNPEPRRVGGLSGRIQWRRQGENLWRDWGQKFEPGMLAFRLVDEAGTSIAERRRVLVFPDGFRPDITTKSASFRLPGGFVSPSAKPGADGRHVLEFGSAETVAMEVEAPGSHVKLVFAKPVSGAFVDLLTREKTTSGRKIISSWLVERMCAVSGQHTPMLEVKRASDRNAAPIALAADGRLNLFQIRAYLQALAFHERGRSHPVLLEFRNAAALQIDSYQSRIKRDGSQLMVQDATRDMELEMVSMVSPGLGARERVIPARVEKDVWQIPDIEEPSHLYLAVDRTRQALPCLVVWAQHSNQSRGAFMDAVCIREGSEREAALRNVYSNITESPSDARSIEEADILFRWVVDFQLYLEWLDPFLVLASEPALAMKMLVLAEINKQEEAAAAMREALDLVPFFWHRVGASVLTGLMEWAHEKFGPQVIPALPPILERRLIQRNLMIPSRERNERVVQDWEEAITDFGWITPRERKQRPPPMTSFVTTHLWGSQELDPAMKEKLKTQPRSISTHTNIAETYYLAPQELAIAISLGVALEDSQMADFIYARYVIDPRKFDAAYSAALTVIGK